MKKYYTPKIEEFHVGFEYQVINNVDTKTGIYTWRTIYHKVEDSIEQFSGSLNEDSRVKYLDREDIESLGWEYDNNFVEMAESKKISVYSKTMKYNSHDATLMILCNTTNNLMSISWTNAAGASYVAEKRYNDLSIATISVQTSNNIFLGTIKNKSELIKLLKQLGI